VPLRQASRHSTATDLLRKGAETEKIRRLLGHTNTKTTEKYPRFSSQVLVSIIKPRGRHFAAGLPLGQKPTKKINDDKYLLELVHVSHVLTPSVRVSMTVALLLLGLVCHKCLGGEH